MIRVRNLTAIFTVACAALISSCITPQMADSAALAAVNREKGMIYHATPRGNPALPAQWDEWGPGAIRNPGSGSLSATAGRIIGAPTVAGLATMSNASPVEAFDRKIITERDFNLLGSGPATVAATIKAQFGWKSEVEASVTMGKVAEVTLSEQQLVDLCRNNKAAEGLLPSTRKGLRNGNRHLLLAAVYADSMTFTFKKKTTTGGSIEAGLPKTGNITIGGNNYTYTESGLTMTEPRFLGYRILGRDEVRAVF